MYLRSEEKWTPLHTRFVAHRIGDGTVNVHGYPVWDNKDITKFLQLAKQLKIKLWKPVISDDYGTYKVALPKEPFFELARICRADGTRLIHDTAYLLRNLRKLPRAHRLQVLAALIFDDGSCANWMMVAFEDQKRAVVMEAYRLWKDLFGSNTAKIMTRKTKMGTMMYRISVNRDGIIKLYEELKESIREHGDLAGLWRKQKALEARYRKATSPKALKMQERKLMEHMWRTKILNIAKKRGFIRPAKIYKITGREVNTTLRIIAPLLASKQLFFVKAGNRTRYSTNPVDSSIEIRQRLIISFLKREGRINNRQARKLLGLGIERTLVILKKLVSSGELAQIKPNGANQLTFYALRRG